MQRLKQRTLLMTSLYAWALVRQFRWTLALLGAAVLGGGVLYALAPDQLPNKGGNFTECMYWAWMALIGQPLQPGPWYLYWLTAIYPLFGIVLIGEGVVRLAMLIISKRAGEKEWMNVMASAHHDHVVLCGIGHLGYRVLQQLVESKVAVVALELDGNGRFVANAKNLGVPVLIGDMKDDQQLINAGVPHARVIIIATNDDLANLEVALDARRMNPKIRVLMRQFDQQVAGKISGALSIDAAFSSSALAAPIVVAMSLGAKILATFTVANVPHVTGELIIENGSALAGKRAADIEKEFNARVLARSRGASALPLDGQLSAGETLVVYTEYARMSSLAAASKALH
jgi:Trk K+ transport system NAD-binding subunit